MYFLRRLRPLEVAGERIRSLRVSLNAPVISAPDLPAGPARAVIVVHREARGGMDATVGVRSIAGGELAYWSFDGELSSEADLSVAADAALTFAESLGFLFEEESQIGASAEKAFQTWRTSGNAGGGLATARAPAGRSAANEPEAVARAALELDEIMLDEAEPLAAVPRRPAPATPPLPQKSLSKFRGRELAPAVSADAAKQAQRKSTARRPLARVQLVKRRSPDDERKLAIRRLLTSF